MKKETRNLAIGVAVAAGVGYVAGLLTAPKSGKETRQDIKNAAAKAKTEAEQRLKYVHSELVTLIEKAKPHIKEVSVKTRAGYEKALAQAQRSRDKVKGILTAMHEGEAEDEDLGKAIKEAQKSAEHLETYLKKK